MPASTRRSRVVHVFMAVAIALLAALPGALRSAGPPPGKPVGAPPSAAANANDPGPPGAEGVAIHPERRVAVVTRSKRNAVAFVDISSGEAVSMVRPGSRPGASHPRDTVIDPGRDLALVTLGREDTVAVLRMDDGEMIATVPVGREPDALAIDPELGLAIAANRKDGTLSVIELDTRSVIATLPVGRDPGGVAMEKGSARAWVSLGKEGVVRVVDLAAGAVIATVPAGLHPAGIAVSAGHGIAAVADSRGGTVTLIETASFARQATVGVGREPRGVAIDEASGLVLAANHGSDTVSLIDIDSAKVAATVPVLRGPERIAVDPGIAAAIVTGRDHRAFMRLALPDRVPPDIVVDFPPDGYLTNRPEVDVIGNVSEPAALAIAGQAVPVDGNGRFSHGILLEEGTNDIELLAVDEAGNAGRRIVRIRRDTEPPGAPRTNRVVASGPVDGLVTVSGDPGSVEPWGLVTVVNLRTGEGASALAGPDGAFRIALAGEGGDLYAVHVTDEAGNEGVAATVASGDLPPDPAAQAPALAQDAFTPFAAATAFLHSGPRPVQEGLAPGVIEAARAAVLRGRIRDRSGAPVAGARVTVRAHPEFGETRSRADGAFDLVVNGGGALVVDYEREGYLPVQRRIDVPWRDYAWLPDVVMIPLDGEVTSLAFPSSATQVARGGAVEDDDGARRATLVVPPDTQAVLELADGSRMPVASLDVRATEYTVGEDGPKAMPGELPPAVGYTYAVELSADEAQAAGATAVRFDRPLAFYLENFIGFPVGGIVPAGWYDRMQGSWVPAANGRVVRIAAVEAGVAVLDVDGSGQSAGPEALAVLGITAGELRTIATLYEPGDTLWRVPIDHFTPWDFNWPARPPAGALPPRDPPRGERKEDRPECERGSIIECENQVLGQTLPLAGTAWTLAYRSDRVPGHEAAFRIDIPLTGTEVHPALRRVDLEVAIAGQRLARSFAPAADQSWTYVWDGRDGYGRMVRGTRRARVRVTYVYHSAYLEPSGFIRSFGEFGGDALDGIPARATYPMSRVWEVSLGVFDARQAGLGGWSLSHHHAYDPEARVLYTGDGGRRDGRYFGPLIEPVAGTGTRGFGGDGGPALEAGLGRPSGVAVAPDGSVYVADGAFFSSDRDTNGRVRRIAPDGTITTVAGGGTTLGDGGPATAARLGFPTDVALGPDGSLYIADGAPLGTAGEENHRVRRVAPDGVITTVAGNGIAGFSGDGGPATAASINLPMGLAVAADGSLYIADWLNSRIRRVAPDGIITTIAGNGEWGFSGDGGPASEARLRDPAGLAFGPDGAVYFADWGSNRIRRVSPDGTITTVAGGGAGNVGADVEGIPATQATLLLPSDVAVGRDGSLYIADMGNMRIRRVGPEGGISTLAGDGDFESSGDGGLAASARLAEPTGLALGPDDSLYVTERVGRVRRIGLESNRATGGEGHYALGAEGGAEYYVFDAEGRHLRTVDSVTGAEMLSFEYGDGGLAAVTDADGLRLAVDRDPSGRPLGILAPDGSRTGLETGVEGFLAALVDPLGAAWSMAYRNGLLTMLRDPHGHESSYDFDPLGRLASTHDAAGGGWTLRRDEWAQGHATTLTSAEGRMRRFGIEAHPAGGSVRRVTEADGTMTVRRLADDGTEVTTLPDGTRVTLRLGPDPRLPAAPLLPVALRIETPGGIAGEALVEREAALADPGDFMSHTELVERIALNGSIGEVRYTAGDRRWLGTSAAGRTWSLELDADGRPARWQAGILLPVDIGRDSHGRVVTLEQGERRYRLHYDETGRLAGIEDPLARMTAFGYDGAGRMTHETLPGGRVIGYDRDAGGNLRAITTPGGETHRFAWTALDLAEAYEPPALDDPAGITRLAYDLDRALVRVDRPDGSAIDVLYDAAGRLSTFLTDAGRYDYRYDPLTGRPSGVSAPDGTGLDWTWDGFLPVSESMSGEVSGTVTRVWNEDFRLAALTVAGETIEFARDPDGLLERAGALHLERDPASGLVTATRLGDVTTRTQYNDHGEPVAFTAWHQEGLIARFTLERDVSGRIVARTGEYSGEASSEHYGYDGAGRLASVDRDGAVSSWGFDDNGNRTHMDGALVAVFDAQDRLVAHGSETYTYTPNGELMVRTAAGAETRFTYDAFGNLRRVTRPDAYSIEYLVDGRNRRVGKKLDGELVQGFLYADQLNPVAELDGAGIVRSLFVYADLPNVPAYMVRAGSTYRILSDHLGSPRLVVDVADGRIAQRIDYDAWGRITFDSNPGFQPFGFAGGIHDRHTGLVRFGARDYDPHTGRWLSKDPLGFDGGDTNLYAYVTSDPVNFLDPRGEFLVNVAGGFLGALAGAGSAAAAGQSVMGGALSGAIAGFWLGGGIVANAAIGTGAGVLGYLIDPRGCGPTFRGLFGAAGAGALGGVIGRELGLRNGLAVARLGHGRGEIIGHGTAVASAYHAQAVGGAFASGGLSAVMQ